MIAALVLASVVAATSTHLEVRPWSGKDLPTSSHAAVKYRLIVTGKPNAHLRLEATALANGWLGAFCTSQVCAPGHVAVDLPPSGRAVYQFELIREDDSAPGKSGARIVGDDGSSVDVPVATR
ncbi:MAG TPA: hypothetical protein VFE36_08580 [Candidatus Baltobacteraceae bacterium]|jgi:hypothetical protein|nr:hypothetical protein [Candidatus Baltobacteraceae bacterium]